jgi:hypothetical protein
MSSCPLRPLTHCQHFKTDIFNYNQVSGVFVTNMKGSGLDDWIY